MSLWGTFIDEVREAEVSLGDAGKLWYRGHKDTSYELVPSLYRYENGLEVERVLFEEYVNFGGSKMTRVLYKAYENGELSLSPDPDWITVFDMQHWGIPTRLLDWSERLSIAIAFAVLDREKHETSDAAIFVLDPIRLNHISLGKQAIPKIGEQGFEYIRLYLEKTPVPPVNPIAIEPAKHYQNDRMVEQHSTFTVHGMDTAPLERQAPNVLRKIVMPFSMFDEARRHLRQERVSLEHIFPDLVGLSRHLRMKYLSPTPPPTPR